MLLGQRIFACVVIMGMSLGCRSQIAPDVSKSKGSDGDPPKDGVSSRDDGDKVSDPGDDKTSTEMKILGLKPSVVSPEVEVEVIGQGFKPTMQLALADGRDLGVQVESDVQASFVAPKDLPVGELALVAMQDGVQQSFMLLSDGGKSDYPVFNGSAEMICKGAKFYDSKGNLVEGTGVCGAPEIPECKSDGEVGCITTETYKAVNVQDLASKILAGESVAGVVGTGSADADECGSDGETGCIATADFPSVDKTTLVPGNIRFGVTIGSVAGSVVPRPADCANDGEEGCVTTAALKAAKMSNFAASDIRSGVTIAGVPGSIADRGTWNLTTSFPGAGLYAGVSNAPSAGQIKRGETVLGVTGNFPSAASPLPRYSDDGASTNTTGSDIDDLTNFQSQLTTDGTFEFWDSAGVRRTGAGDSDIKAANVVDGVEFENLGVTGTAAAGGNCTGDGQVGCMTTTRYKSMDTDSSVISAWDIRKGKTVGGINGALAFHKNLNGAYNRTTGTGSHAGADKNDTTDDYNAGGAYPSTVPKVTSGGADIPGWPSAPGSNWLRDAASDTNSNGLCDGGEDCVFIDRISGQYWTAGGSSDTDWAGALDHCENLNSTSYGTYANWRVPTQKELTLVYANGIWTQKDATKLNLSNVKWYWSATASSMSTTTKYVQNFADGRQSTAGDTYNEGRAICVRDDI